MHSFVGKVKNSIEDKARIIKMSNINGISTTSKYSELKDEISTSSTITKEDVNTPLSSDKHAYINYGLNNNDSVVDMSGENSNIKDNNNKSFVNENNNKSFKYSRSNSGTSMTDRLKRRFSNMTARQETRSSLNDMSKNKAIKKMMLQHVGIRLSRRKELHNKRRKIADLMFILGALGVLLMIWLIELNFDEQYKIKKDHVIKYNQLPQRFPHWDQTTGAITLKCLITLTTVVLIGLIFVYHRLDMQIYCIDNSIDDWRIALTPSRMVVIIFECIICAIHPVPGNYVLSWKTEQIVTTTSANNGTIAIIDLVTDSIPLDIILAVPMFARLYLLSRTILLHSKLVTDASSQSLGYLNRINFNFPFVFKVYNLFCLKIKKIFHILIFSSLILGFYDTMS